MIDTIQDKYQQRRQPKQSRSRALVDAVYEACIRIIDRGDVDKLSVTTIAKTAGITSSSFYHYFPNADSAVAAALLKSDQDHARAAALKEYFKRPLTALQVIEFLVNAICDRHIRFLKKYGDVYRRYHRSVNAQLCIGFDANGFAILMNWEDWIEHVFETYCVLAQKSTQISIFIKTAIIVETMAKTIDERPGFLEDQSFRNSLIEIVYLKSEQNS